MGVKFGGEGYTLQVMAVSGGPAINGVGWLLLVGLFAHKLEDVREKVAAETRNGWASFPRRP